MLNAKAKGGFGMTLRSCKVDSFPDSRVQIC